MNRYFLIRRLTGPAILLLIGVIALLHQADLVSWHLFWPLLLILLGLLKLAQRAALAAAGDEAFYQGPYPPQGGYPYGAPPQAPGTQPIPQGTGTSIVPSQQGFGHDPKGGQ